MSNPIAYLIENISWYEPIYNIAWILFMIYALTLPLLLLAIFKLPPLRDIQPTQSWTYHFQSYRYLFGAAFVVFSFRLIPYWIFNDKLLHFLGGGFAIALVYEYLVLNFNLEQGQGIFSLKFAISGRKSTHRDLVCGQLFRKDRRMFERDLVFRRRRTDIVRENIVDLALFGRDMIVGEIVPPDLRDTE
jgi:hypothetical protein